MESVRKPSDGTERHSVSGPAEHDLELLLSQDRDALAALQNGEIDALVVRSPEGERVFTLSGADQLYQVLFASLSEGAITLSADGVILHANPRTSQVLRVEPEELLGSPFEHFLRLEDRESFRRLLQDAAGGKTRAELTLTTPDGAGTPVILSLNRVEIGSTIYWTAVLTDLTERRKAEIALQQANFDLERRVQERTAELEQVNSALRREILRREVLEDELRRRADELTRADQRKDLLLSMLAHELRNPLAPIANSIEALAIIAPENPGIERHRRVIDRQVRHLSRLIEDLLDVSRITRGVVKLQRQVVDLRDVARRAAEDVEPHLRSQAHRFELNLPDEPAMALVDPTRIEQVFVNLLNNAAKYTEPHGSIEARVQIEGERVILSVQDSGIGISSELLPQVFDLFVQADRSLDRSRGGLGIGLTLVKELVELHGGRVDVTSPGEGLGSEFRVILPRALTTCSGEVPAPHPGPEVRRRRILVVDDNRDAAETLAEVLELWGHRIEVAFDGESGLKIAEQCQPEVVLLDIGLPGMDGYEVAAEMRRIPSLAKTRFIALSGYDQRQSQGEWRSTFDAHLLKPVEPEVLKELLHSTRPPDR